MSILDKLAESRVNVRRVLSEEDDELSFFEFDGSESIDTFVKNHLEFRIWLNVHARKDDPENNAFDMLRVLKNYFVEIPTVGRWSHIYIVDRNREIVVGFNPDVRNARSGIRLILSLLSIIRREKVSSGGIVHFMFMNKIGCVYNIIFTVDYIEEFDKLNQDISGLRDFLKIICHRFNDISEREFRKAVAKTSIRIDRMRQKGWRYISDDECSS